MQFNDLEKYILAKESVSKKAIPEWNYIRYTVYSSMFAAVGESKKGKHVTVWGSFEHHKREYPHAFVAAIDNDTTHYTSIFFESANLPDGVIKSAIDFSYREVLKSVPMPSPSVSKFEKVPYCGIAPLYDSEIKSAIAAKSKLTARAVEASVGADDDISYDYGMNKKTEREVPQLESLGRFDKIPYNAVHDERKREAIIKLLKMQSKK